MNKHLLLICAIIFSTVLNTGNCQSNLFTRVYYDYVQIYSVIETSDNAFLHGGVGPSAMLLKTDSAGNIIWGRTTTAESYYDVIETNDSHLVAVGKIGYPFTDDAVITKFKLNGDTVWSKAINFGGKDVALNVAATNDGHYLLSGYSWYFSTPHTVSFLAKLDTSGNIVWARTFYSGDFSENKTLKISADSCYIVGGGTGTAGNQQSQDAFLMKISPAGNLLWDKIYSSGAYTAVLQDAVALPNGYLSCFENVYNGYQLLMKADTAGTPLWAVSTFGSGYVIDDVISRKILKTSDGHFLVTGAECMSKFDSTGNRIFSKILVSSVTDIIETSDSSYYIVGNGPIPGVMKMMSQLANHFGVIKTDTAGNGPDCTYSSWGNNMVTESLTTVSGSFSFAPLTVSSVTHFDVIDTVTFASYPGCVEGQTGIQEYGNQYKLKTFPNPASNDFTIIADSDIEHVEIINSIGAKVLAIKMYGKEIKINTSSLPNGIYFLKVYFSDGSSSTEKFSVAR